MSRRDPEREPWYSWPITLIALILAALIVTQYIDDTTEFIADVEHIRASR